MNNIPLDNHPLIHTAHIYRPDLPVWTPPASSEADPGVTVVAPGMQVEVRAVFQNWNDVADLDMLYVYCATTGLSTHVTPADLGLPPLVKRAPGCDGLPLHLTTCADKAGHM